MAGRRQKHPDALVNKRGGRYTALRVVEPVERLMPETPQGLHHKAEAAWVTLWSSNLGGAFKDTDVFGLRRWVWYYSEWEKAVSLPGDRRYVLALERALRELEKEYGLGAFARVRLGLTLVDEAKAVQGLKAPVAPKRMEASG